MEVLSLLGWTVTGIVLLITYFLYKVWPHNTLKGLGFPGPEPVFIWTGLALLRKNQMWHIDRHLIQQYGKVVGLPSNFQNTVLVADPEMLKEIYIKYSENFPERNPIPSRGILKLAVSDTSGLTWKKQRHSLSPYFSAGSMKLTTSGLNGALDNMNDWLEGKCNKEEMLEAKKFCQMITIDMICSTAFGIEVDSAKNPDLELLKKSREAFEKLAQISFLGIMVFFFPALDKILDFFNIHLFGFSYLAKFTRQLISHRQGSKCDNQNADFVTRLLNDRNTHNKGLSDEEIIANAIIFLIAGYDTTANTLSYFLYTMVVNPEWQEKVYQEIQEKLGTEKPTYESIKQMKYLEMCLQESQRLYPILTRLERLCQKDTLIKGFQFKKGTLVSLPVWYMHHDEEVWENPDTFNPERFTPENKKVRDQMSFVPFGVGPRHCIGMRLALLQVEIAAARILQKFKLVKNSKTQVPLEFKKGTFIQPFPKDGIWLTLEKRE